MAAPGEDHENLRAGPVLRPDPAVPLPVPDNHVVDLRFLIAAADGLVDKGRGVDGDGRLWYIDVVLLVRPGALLYAEGEPCCGC